MTSGDINQAALAAHGAARLPAVEVGRYNVELKDDGGFVGDRASKGAFREFIEEWRKPLRALGEDPFGKQPSSTIDKKRLDELLAAGDSEAAAIESFAQRLAEVTQRFFRLKEWKQTERLVVGGGIAGTRAGEIAIGRASVILKAENKVDIVTIRHEPNHAGLLGAAHLAPAWIFKGHDASLAVDIGGTNIRAGLLELNLKRDPTLAKAKVLNHELWRHADDTPSRDEAVDSLIRMLSG